MKKSIVVLVLMALCLCSIFAVSQIRTSIIPFSWLRLDSDFNEEYKLRNSNYAWGLKASYSYTLHNGITLGAEVGSSHYLFPEGVIVGEVDEPETGNRTCGVTNLIAKFGYFTPQHKEKRIRYFVYGEAGGRLMNVAETVSINPIFGVEVGLVFSLPKNFNVGFSVEPQISFSEMKLKDKDVNVKFTDLYVTANLILGYEF